MINILKKILLKLSNNEKLKEKANRVFVYFPSLKYILIEFIYSNKNQKKHVKTKYKNNFLTTIKSEVEKRKNNE